MNATQIFQWLLNQKTTYHQKFAQSQPRINPELEKLTPLGQFKLIYNCLSQIIVDSLLDGKGLNIQYFGAFCFQIQQESEKEKLKKIKECIMDKPKDKIKCKLTFIPGAQLTSVLKGSFKQSTDAKQSSIYTAGYEMQFCSYYMLASVCSLKLDVVNEILESFFKTVIDLTAHGENLALDFKFCQIYITNKTIQYYYDKGLQNEMNKLSMPELEYLKSLKLGCDVWKSNLNQSQTKASSIYHSIPPSLYAESFKEKVPNPKKINPQTKKLAEASKDLTGIHHEPKFIYK